MSAFKSVTFNERCVWKLASSTWNGDTALGEEKVPRRKFLAGKRKGKLLLFCFEGERGSITLVLFLLFLLILCLLLLDFVIFQEGVCVEKEKIATGCLNFLHTWRSRSRVCLVFAGCK